MTKMNNFEVLTMIGTMIDSLNFENSMSESMHWHVTENGAIVYTMDKEQSQRFIDPLIEDEIKSYNNAAIIFEDIDKDTISEWRDSYDNTKQYPTVLPTKGFYNIVNGTQGIGIGMA